MIEETHLAGGSFHHICTYASTLSKNIDLEEDLEHGFYVYDLEELKDSYQQWNTYFPMIHPYYAVKCNPDAGILRELAKCGANFDCASPAEITTVLEQNVNPDRILYANPCKSTHDIRYARAHNVKSTTFDTVYELEKIHKYAPDMECVLRIYACDPNAQCQLSNKFGAHEHEWDSILLRAKELNINLIGISFHVGSGASSATAYEHAIQQARKLCILAEDYGYHLHLLDIGGGFMKKHLASSSLPYIIRRALEENGFMDPYYRIIAEPGRYFAESCGHLFTKVLGIRDRSSTHRDYWISDSLYGSFNCVLYDHIHPKPYILRDVLANNHTHHITHVDDIIPSPPETPPLSLDIDNESPTSEYRHSQGGYTSDISVQSNDSGASTDSMISTLFGPTCDGMDIVLKDVVLPRLELDDWIAFKDMGAYTIAGACIFNGIGFPFIPKYYVRSKK